MGSGQVLSRPYTTEEARMIVREMTDLLVWELVEKNCFTDQMVLTLGYDVENMQNAARKKAYRGEIKTDRYGRQVPKNAHGSAHLDFPTKSARLILPLVIGLFDRIADPKLSVRRIYVTANHLSTEKTLSRSVRQLDIFSEMDLPSPEELAREERRQRAILSIQKKYGKNALLKGTSLQDGATARARNRQVGGHKA